MSHPESIQRLHQCDGRTGQPCPLCDGDRGDRLRLVAAATARMVRDVLGTDPRSTLTRAGVNREARIAAVLAVHGDRADDVGPFACVVCGGDGAWHPDVACWECAVRGTSARVSRWFDYRRRARQLARRWSSILNASTGVAS